MKYLYIVPFILFVNSCTTSNKELTKTKVVKNVQYKKKIDKVEKKSKKIKTLIRDLKIISQNVTKYSYSITPTKLKSQKEFERDYFRVWRIDRSKISLDDAKWAHKSYGVGFTYGENLQLLTSSFYKDTLKNANYNSYLSLNKKAVTIKLLDIRAMPTSKPILLDPTKAGEGYPFDYLQNSTIAANKPIIISHYSKDKKWAFIETSFTYGWVKSADIVVLDEKYTKLWKKAEQVVITKEGIPIYSEYGEFLFNSRVGTLFALIGEDESSYTVLTVGKCEDKSPLFFKSKLNKKIAHKGILEFNSVNIDKIINEVSKTNYGWGGLYGQRDCSSTLRDFYAPFGVWLPRNSYQQSIYGRRIMLDKLTSDAKRELIAKKAIPFRTLLYKKGHIALYVGEKEGKHIIFQNIWGIKTMKNGVEGRYIIGRPIFSTLEVGSDLNDYDKNSSMLQHLRSMTIL